jgi:hypothetical protein
LPKSVGSPLAPPPAAGCAPAPPEIMREKGHDALSSGEVCIAAAMQPHLFNPERPPVLRVAALGELGGAVGAAMLCGPLA